MAMWIRLHLLSMWRHVAPGSQASSFLLLLLLLFLLASATEGALEAEALSFLFLSKPLKGFSEHMRH